MADRFISIQNGNDANTGLSVAQAKATITGMIATPVAAGDTIYIGPGTYRENPSLATAGGAGNEIRWIPDPEAQFLTDDNPGIVRVTGCGVNELPTAGIVWTTGVDYNTLGDPLKGFGQIYLDGSSDLQTFSGVANSPGRDCYGVVAHGKDSGIYRPQKAEYCIAVGGSAGIIAPYDAIKHCISVGGDRGITAHVTAEHCLAIGGNTAGVFGGTNTNCISIGGNNGFYSTSTLTCKNCIAIAAGVGGFRGSAGSVFANCLSIACNRAVYGNAIDSLIDTSSLYQIYCNSLRRGGNAETGDPINATAVLYDLVPLLQTFLPILQTNFNLGDNTVTVGDYDILGHLRRLGSGIIDIGPYEHSIADPEFTEIKTASPALKIEHIGQQKFVFWGEGGVAFTKKVWVKWGNYAGALFPQIIVDGAHVTRTTTPAAGPGLDWEELSVNATPDADGEVELFLTTRDAGTFATLSTDLVGNNNDLVYTSKLPGADGNAISVEYIDPGAPDQALAIVVTAQKITVNLATGGGAGAITSTAGDIETAIGASVAASLLVSVADKAGNDGSGVVTAMAEAALTGGVTAVTYFSDLE